VVVAIRYWSPTVVHDDGAPPARVGNIGALETLGATAADTTAHRSKRSDNLKR